MIEGAISKESTVLVPNSRRASSIFGLIGRVCPVCSGRGARRVRRKAGNCAGLEAYSGFVGESGFLRIRAVKKTAR